MKTSRILLIIIGIIVILPLLGRLIWELKTGRILDIMIVNKSVPKSSENELKAVNWILNYNKYIKSTENLYNFKRDYYGFHPDAADENRQIESFKLEDIEELADKYDALLFIDNSGVELNQKSATSSKTWYGGLNQNDYLIIKEMMARHKLLIAEYNFFFEPTEDLVRFNTEQVLDIFSLGWKGRFLKNLELSAISNQLPAMCIDIYRKANGKDWDFTGPGIILLNEGLQRILVLPAAEYMISKYPEVRSSGSEASALIELPESAAFTGWFGIVYPGNNSVLSQIDLNLNDKGKALLHDNGLEPVFPALIKSPDNKIFFIAGDFSKSPVNMIISKNSLIAPLCMKISGSMNKNPAKFFQTYYYKFFSSVLGNYYKEIKK